MFFHRVPAAVVAVAVAAGSVGVAQAETPIDATFTYQGKLVQGGVAVNASADFIFRIYDSEIAGNQIDDLIQVNNVTVADGSFTVQLNVPPGVFNGAKRWLGISVRSPHDPSGTGAFTTLQPRQPVTAAPYASHAGKIDGLYVDSDGTVVIGAEEPRSGDLYVENLVPRITLDTVSDDSGARGELRFSHHGQLGGYLIWNAESEQMTLSTGTGSSTTTLAILEGGRVGIGQTPGADAAFHVRRSEDASVEGDGGILQLGFTNYGNLALDNNEIMARNGGTTAPLYINHEGGDVLMGATSNGDTHVGINTSNPGSFSLAVNGAAAKPGGGNWSNFSDARLKHNIKPLKQGTLEKVLSLRGYTFEYDTEAIEKRLALPGTQIGLIAQEVEQVFPDWVDEDAEGYKFVTERGTTALFVEAMRELRSEKDAEIAVLRRTIDEQRQQFAEQLRHIDVQQQQQIDELRELVLQLASQSAQQ